MTDLTRYRISSSELDGAELQCTRCSVYDWNPLQLDGTTLADLIALAEQHEQTHRTAARARLDRLAQVRPDGLPTYQPDGITPYPA